MARKIGCAGCKSGETFDIPFTMAFQPIVDVDAGLIWGYEALVRGMDGQGAQAILSEVTAKNLYSFDQACRVKAIELAAEKLGSTSTARLSINFMPRAVYEPRACISATLAAAKRTGFDPHRLMFEFTENERIADVDLLERIIIAYREMGFYTALDDFGAGYAGLGLLARFQPDVIKIDMDLLRNIAESSARKAIVTGIVAIAKSLKVRVLAEGVETDGELLTLHALGISLFQGYLFARPEIERFATDASIRYLHSAEAKAI